MIAALPLVASGISSLFGTGQAASVASPAAPAGDASFSSLMASLTSDTVGKLKTAETMSVAGIQGKATAQSVVEAVMSAQEALQTAVAVRDKAVSAFQDITRMAI